MKNNKKGFVAITIIYSFFILFVTIMLLIMYSYINDRKTNNKIKSDLINNIRNKAPDILISSNGSINPHEQYEVTVNVLDGGNGIASAKYIWSPTPIGIPDTDLSSYTQTLTSPTEPGYYYLIVKACDINENCKTAITNSFRIGEPLLCLKAKALHSEECTNTDEEGHCLLAGYENNSNIVFGNIPIYETSHVGDAYDCDVNGDGEYDQNNERFYFLSDYFDTDTQKYNNSRAVLIYYTNVHNGTINATNTSAYTTGTTVIPETLYSEMPSNEQWSESPLLVMARNIISASGVEPFIKEYKYTGDVQTFTAYFPGTYKIELWGAQGGGTDTSPGGKGAFTVGTINLDKNDTLYIYVGEKGKSNASTTNPGGYNGGGYSGNDGGSQSYGGGGATDVRLVSGSWNDATGLKSRIMVAAGGGGNISASSRYSVTPGVGGTLVGGKASGTYDANEPDGGTQTGPGKVGADNKKGIFGGGVQSYVSGFGGGGGGGYWGGSMGHGHAGSGGSSYISGHEGCIALNSAESLDPKPDCDSFPYTVSCSIHYSGKQFTNTEIFSGDEFMPTQDGEYIMIGNEGDGFARITFMGPFTEEPINNAFMYTNKNARLLTYKELYNCLDFATFGGEGALEVKVKDECNFLLEKTAFTTSGKVEGYFLETPSDDEGNIWVIDSGTISAYNGTSKTTSNKYGARPVIEVDKSRLEY